MTGVQTCALPISCRALLSRIKVMSVTISAIVKMKRTSTKINNIMTNKYNDVLSANLVPLWPSSLRDVDEPDPYYHSS